MKNDEIKMLEIKEIKKEAEGIRSFFFSKSIEATPGQYIMLWVPEVGEKPFSVSYSNSNLFGITVKKIGPFTSKLFEIKRGEKLGVRGPYGKGFEIKGEKVALVGGGIGMAPLGFLGERMKNKKIFSFIGARTEKEMIFEKRMKRIGKVTIATDDGSAGKKGFITEELENFLEENKIDNIYACGPAPMLKRIAEIGEERAIETQISLERKIKCGVGICGNCLIGDFRVCKDGPIISGKKALQIGAFK